MPSQPYGVVGLSRGIVQLLPYQQGWRMLFEEEAERIRAAFSEKVVRIEHIGSTAVPDMPAKPIIDMVAALESGVEARELMTLLESLGYEHRPDSGDKERIFLVKGPESRRTHHLSLVDPASETWRRKLIFRDYLLAHPGVGDRYSKLKRALARRYPEDRQSYTAAKQRFIDGVVEGAEGQHGR